MKKIGQYGDVKDAKSVFIFHFKNKASKKAVP